MNLDKIQLLDNSFDVACGTSSKDGLGFIFDASTPRGKCPMFKSLYSNKCVHDCKYCKNAKSSKTTRASFEPKEMARTYIDMAYNHRLEGIFLSSAVEKDADTTTQKMLEVTKILRLSYNYKGYIHFKVLPGTSYELVKEASQYSDRMSINIESPNKHVLAEITSNKDYKNDILRRQAWLKNLGVDQTTQMIFGAAHETDFEIMKMVDWEYKNMELKRIYYSAFKPIKGTSFENKQPASLTRRNRLYNVDYLYRKYNYKLKEFEQILDKNDMLPRQDPKLKLAIETFTNAIDVNEADYAELIRVPGIGPKIANRIVGLRGRIKKRKDLHKLGVALNRAEPFIRIDGNRQRMIKEFV